MADAEDLVYDDTPETAPVIAKSHLSITAKKARELRESPIFKKLKEKFREKCSRENHACALCSLDIDYRLKYPHPMSWSCDHIVPVKEKPSLLMDIGNLQASHLECNYHKGSDSDSVIALGSPSEVW